jgi:hypothetical protein
MATLYRALLFLYPRSYRREFGGEMALVFEEAQIALGNKLSARVWFYAREIVGLFAGAVCEHTHALTLSRESNSIRRLNMRRFPTSAITLMIVILAGVVLTIENAHRVQLKYEPSAISVWDTLPGFVAIGLVLVCCSAVAGWAILFALHRTGMHRLDNVQTWNEQK